MTILLSDVVAQVESAQNPLAMRFEMGWSATPAGIQAVEDFGVGGFIDVATARVICQTSWGKYQIMGDNLFNLCKYQKTIFHFLGSEDDQLAIFKKFIETIGFSDVPFSTMTTAQKVNFAEKYNGSFVYANSLDEAYAGMTS